MSIKREERDGVIILRLEEQLTIGKHGFILDFREAIRMATGRKVILDMSGVPVIDAEGIGQLVGAYTSIKYSGGGLVLLQVQPKLIELLRVTQLIAVFEIYGDETEAIEAVLRMEPVSRTA